MTTSLRRRYQSDLLTLDAQKRTGEITRAQYDDARIRLAKEMAWRGLVLPTRTASPEFRAIDLPEWLVMVNGSHHMAAMSIGEAQGVADAYRAIYRLAIVTIEHVSEFSDWRI